MGYVVMETSSQGLAQHRLAGLTFDTAVFTNLTQEHLDYHGTMEAYLAAKLMLFAQLAADGVAMLNGDAPAAVQIAEAVGKRRVWTYSLQNDADLRCKDVELSLSRVAFTAVTPHGEMSAQLRLLGEYNLYNALAAIGVGIRYGCPIAAIQEGLAATVVPGRFELVDKGQDFAVIVDTRIRPMDWKMCCARREALLTARSSLFSVAAGTGMSANARKWGRFRRNSRITASSLPDNPRTEEPAEIIAQIVSNLPHDTHYVSILQRREAIQHAIATAKPGDVIVIAGKGHEDYQGNSRTTFPSLTIGRWPPRRFSVVRKAKQDLQDLQDEQDEESKVDIDVVDIYYYDSSCLSKLTISTLHTRARAKAMQSFFCTDGVVKRIVSSRYSNGSHRHTKSTPWIFRDSARATSRRLRGAPPITRGASQRFLRNSASGSASHRALVWREDFYHHRRGTPGKGCETHPR